MKGSDPFSWPLTLMITSAIEVVLALALVLADSHNKFSGHFFFLSFIMCSIAAALLAYQQLKIKKKK